jgi:hypothetical protein
MVHTRHWIPHDGQRYHHGEALAMGWVEPTGHQVVSIRFWKKHQMPWS